MINVNQKVQNIARLCHEANRVLQLTLEEEPNPPWDALSEDLKDSIYIGVLNALDGKTPEELHELWTMERKDQGWVWGHPLNREKKIHPNLVPYSMLPIEQKMKDTMFLAIVANYRR